MTDKPDKLPEWATIPTEPIVEPSQGKKEGGWLENERPPSQFFNYWKNKVFQWIEYFNDQPVGAQLLGATFEERAPVSGTDNVMFSVAHAPAPTGPKAGGDDLGVWVTASGGSDGSGPDIYRSRTGDVWVFAGTIPAGPSNGIEDLLFAFNVFVAIGLGGGMSSPDGDVWTTRAQPFTGRAGIFNGNKVIGIGIAADAESSVDGTAWITEAGAFSTNWVGVNPSALGANLSNNRIFAGGDNNQIQTSDDDGTSFTQRNASGAAIGGFTERILDFHHDGSTLIGVGENQLIIRSTDDGLNFSAIQGDNTPSQAYNLFRVIKVLGHWYAFGGDSTFQDVGYVQISDDDGVTFGAKIPITEFHIRGVAFSGNSLVLVGDKGGNVGLASGLKFGSV